MKNTLASFLILISLPLGAATVPLSIVANLDASLGTNNATASDGDILTKTGNALKFVTPSAGGSSLYISNTVWVATSANGGSDSTGVVGRQDLPFLTLSNAIIAIRTNGGTINIGPGTFRAPSFITNSVTYGWHFEGSGRPNGGFADLELSGGTIINGTLGFDAHNVTVRHLGIDVGPVAVTNLFGGDPQNGIIMYNSYHTNQSICGDGQGNGVAMKQNCIVEDVITLGNDTVTGVHGMLFENVADGVFRDLVCYKSGIGIVLKGRQCHLSKFFSQGHRLGNLIIKDDDYAPLAFCTITDGLIPAAEYQTDIGVLFQIHCGPTAASNRAIVINNVIVQLMDKAIKFEDNGGAVWANSLVFGNVYSDNSATGITGTGPSTFHLNP